MVILKTFSLPTPLRERRRTPITAAYSNASPSLNQIKTQLILFLGRSVSATVFISHNPLILQITWYFLFSDAVAVFTWVKSILTLQVLEPGIRKAVLKISSPQTSETSSHRPAENVCNSGTVRGTATRSCLIDARREYVFLSKITSIIYGLWKSKAAYEISNVR